MNLVAWVTCLFSQEELQLTRERRQDGGVYTVIGQAGKALTLKKEPSGSVL